MQKVRRISIFSWSKSWIAFIFLQYTYWRSNCVMTSLR